MLMLFLIFSLGLVGSSAAGAEVFVSGTENYPTFRIPAILRMDNGELLVFAEGRHGGDHGWNDIGEKHWATSCFD
jgi:sialidase-1